MKSARKRKVAFPIDVVAREHEVRVRPRNLRWELRTDGLTRPIEDWYFSRERAVYYAIRRALEIGAARVVVEDAEYGIDEILRLDDLLQRRNVA